MRALQEGKAFLAANKDKEGVVETSSGLQYKILKSGEAGGKTPLVGTKCLCHYRGERGIADNGFTASTLVFMVLHRGLLPQTNSPPLWSFVRAAVYICAPVFESGSPDTSFPTELLFPA